MEQYQLPKDLDAESLRRCIEFYKPERLYIRLVGSRGGDVKVNEKLSGKKLAFTLDKTGMRFFINSREVFHFLLQEEYHKGFSLAYERVQPTSDGIGRMIFANGVAPYDPELPEPRTSCLRNVLDGYLVEITFPGRVHLKFHSWWHAPYWKYWEIITPEESEQAGTRLRIGCGDDGDD